MAEVMVNARFLAQPITGVQRYALESVKALDKLMDGDAHGDSLRLTLLAPKRARRHAPDLKHTPLREVGFGGGNLWGQVELPYHARGAAALWSPTNTGPIFHPRHVVTIHDASVLDHPEWFKRGFALWYRLLLSQLARRAARILTDSEYSRLRLIENLEVAPEKVSVVPCGVDGRFRPIEPEKVEAVRDRLNLPRKYVLTLSSLEPRKNIIGLLKSWSLLLSRRAVDEDTHLVLAGGKGAAFRDAGLSSLPERVALTGYVPDEDLPALYSGAAAFAYPSFYEGFGLPPLEAMACGTPVVASASTSIPEVTGGAAILIDPSDTEAIAHALQRLLDDGPLREKMRSAGLERSRTFEWASSARMIHKHLSEIAEGA